MAAPALASVSTLQIIARREDAESQSLPQHIDPYNQNVDKYTYNVVFVLEAIRPLEMLLTVAKGKNECYRANGSLLF